MLSKTKLYKLVNLEEIRLVIPSISQEVHAAILNTKRKTIKEKVNVHSDFLRCIIELFAGYETIIESGEKSGKDEKFYLLRCKEITKKEKEAWERGELGNGPGTTRFVEVEVVSCGELAWECEQCRELWQFSYGIPKKEDKVRYCQNCGRKIVEFVAWGFDSSEEDEEETEVPNV